MNPPKIYGLIGYPVQHSLSPAMHNAAFKALGIAAEYKLFEVKPEQLEDFLLRKIIFNDIEGRPVSTADILGFNITIPHKLKAREMLEKNFPFDHDVHTMQQDLYYVKLSGAVNTVKRNGDILQYWNTDASGFLRSLEEDIGFNPKGKNVLLLGCGGAGRAVIASLSWKNIGINKIYVYEINTGAVESTKAHFSNLSPEWQDILSKKVEFISNIKEIISRCQLLVNASPVGMKEGDPSPIDKNLLHKELAVYDVVYNRNKKTRLVEEAESLGLIAIDGLHMLLSQGVRAFELWLPGQKAPVEVMRKALEEELKR